MQAIIWTEDRVESLKTLWEQGLSASQIAAQIGSVSRNAVIGKVHRLGLAGRVKPQNPHQTKTGRPPKADKPKIGFSTSLTVKSDPSLLAPVVYEGNVIPLNQRCDIMGLKESTCRYPVGDPGSKDFFYCGGRAENSKPYCAFHANITYQSTSDRKRVAMR